MMTVALVNHSSRSRGMEVHGVGCQDIAREQARRRLNGVTTEEIAGEDIAAEIAALLCDDFGDPEAWKPSDIRVMPCCTKGSRS